MHTILHSVVFVFYVHARQIASLYLLEYIQLRIKSKFSKCSRISSRYFWNAAMHLKKSHKLTKVCRKQRRESKRGRERGREESERHLNVANEIHGFQ